MQLEVEQKFAVADVAQLEHRLAQLGPLVRHEAVVQVDRYFAHPARDFAVSDEALRLRRVGLDNYITYKGPKLDATTKTRREIEIALAEGEQPATEASALLEALGFVPVLDVVKTRHHFTVHWQDREVGVSLDEVEGLGKFVELEILATPAELAAARDCLTSLCEHLELRNGERRSYLELLLERRG
ncbi:MAG: class IV adenylate cyclase [Pirellulales bacterium]